MRCVSIYDHDTYKWNLHMIHDDEPDQKRHRTETELPSMPETELVDAVKE